MIDISKVRFPRVKGVGSIVFFSLMYRHSNLITHCELSTYKLTNRVYLYIYTYTNDEFDMVGGELITPPPTNFTLANHP